MRYGNWDVLLFPHGSKTPMQEFRTQCFVTRDNDVPSIHAPSSYGARYISDGRPLTQLPVLTTFVGSLVHNAPFRVSIHSWEQPKASRMLESLTRLGDLITFEARVYIDGVLLASSIFNLRANWPHVIDLCSRNHTLVPLDQLRQKLTAVEVDREGYQEPLRFPPFHQEILHASQWDAAQLLGRIRVVMTEGFTRETTSPENNLEHSFVRVRDVIVFSFQHAPLHILEFSGIAWPNPGMWAQAQSRRIHGSVSGAQQPIMPEVKGDEETHAHSPRRPSHEDVSASEAYSKRDPDNEDYWANQSVRAPQCVSTALAWHQTQHGEATIVRQNGPLADPFLEPRGLNTALSRRIAKGSTEDTPMPDVPSYEQSRNISGMTGITYERQDVRSNNIATHEAIMNQLVEALSPLKSDDDRPHELTNTPSSSRMFIKPALVAQTRPVSLQVAGAGVNSAGRDTEENRPGNGVRKVSTNIISAPPGHSIQSKKEGEVKRGNTPDNRVPGAEFTRQPTLGVNVVGTKSTETLPCSSDSKRKRPLEDVSASVRKTGMDDSISSSPSKKVSKMASADVLLNRQSPHTLPAEEER